MSRLPQLFCLLVLAVACVPEARATPSASHARALLRVGTLSLVSERHWWWLMAGAAAARVEAGATACAGRTGIALDAIVIRPPAADAMPRPGASAPAAAPVRSG